MGSNIYSWVIVGLAVLAANLPFINERCFALIALQRFFLGKPLWFRLFELVVLYFFIGALGFLFESKLGNRFTQTWEFYAITCCLFLVMAFPGFVFRYLRRTNG
ncbi:DUF2818 family protein [Undibacterium sp. SXout7W]|uniref:DUF2818 family protein n=1 Tax=Undibacterium sp. SXout7W TaxID=3413049 RepID=UPI003BEFA34F